MFVAFVWETFPDSGLAESQLCETLAETLNPAPTHIYF